MRISLFSQFRGLVRRAEQWYLETPDRALDLAYDAALKIKAIEDEHFEGKKISPDSSTLRGNVYEYFAADLQKYLRVVRMRLTEFRQSRGIVNTTNPNKVVQPLRTIETIDVGSSQFVPTVRDKPAITVEKLKFIDEILARYAAENLTLEGVSTAMLAVPPETNGSNKALTTPEIEKYPTTAAESTEDFESLSDRTGLLPRSIITTLNRLKRDLDPKSEQEVVQSFRLSKVKTLLAIRFVLILILVPLLVQQGTRNILLTNNLPLGGWINHQFKVENPEKIFLNSEMAEEAVQELQRFEERIKFENTIKEVLEQKILSSEEVETHIKERSAETESRVKEKAAEIAESFAYQSADAIKNWIADIFATITFAFILLRGRREVEILKSFFDEVAYGLSDSAKAFIIILFTDIFVGFHSPHGWEVILEGVAKHFGLPASHDFIFLFIATFPVILDTIFKYWIFRYLNRVSPSAVATMRAMNE